jgi:LacI family transcriptional regulator
MTSREKMITRHDVADLAGVSHMTVTRVLNNSSRVSQKTREKVLAACKKLKFRKNMVASSLKSKRSYAIAVVIPTFSHEIYSRILVGIENEAHKYNYCIIASQVNHNDYISDNLSWDQMENLFSRRVDGLIIDATMTEEFEEKLFQENIPIVCINRPSPTHRFDYIGTDYRCFFNLVTTQLISHGHRNIAFAGGIMSETSQEAFAGYRKAMEQADYKIFPELVVANGFLIENGIEAADKLLDSGRKFTAVVCVSDYMAIGVINGLYRRGKSVPHDVAVTGHAGERIAKYFIPPITTGEQPVNEIAAKSVERLIYKISNKNNKDILTLKLPSKLAERESSALII